MKIRRAGAIGILLTGALEANAAGAQEGLKVEASTRRETPEFLLRFAADSGVLHSLSPRTDSAFDFLPSDRLAKRAGDGFHHLGDLTLRVRTAGEKDWVAADTAAKRQPVTALPVTGDTLSRADLAPALPANFPLQVVRTWLIDGGQLVLRFTLTNKTSAPVEIGALGIPVVFNNVISDRNLAEAHARCVFFDPYVGLDAGYLRVTRLTGLGPALALVPEGGKTPFEAYGPLREPMRPSQTFEGAFEWLVHTGAFAENEWRGARPWNAPTSAAIPPGETRVYGLRFVLAESVRGLEPAMRKAGRPVAVGVPGYILAQSADARLILDYDRAVKSVLVEPSGALEVKQLRPTPSGAKQFSVKGVGWGRARLTVTYSDDLVQTVHYCVTKPAEKTIGDLGDFLFTRQWFDAAGDPFGRSPSVMGFDRERNQIVEQDARVWIAGLGDEGGSSWLIAAMKLFLQPSPEQVAKFERFVDGVLWGKLQYSDGPNRYGVRKSLFYYGQPDFPYRADLDWRSWTSWSKSQSEDIGRGYNYPHVVAAYWSLYRIARNHVGLVKNHGWEWYLEQAFQTTKFLFSRNERGERRVGWVELGLMGGTVFVELLNDLEREGWTERHAEIEKLMRERADRWRHEAYPFGSEMAWDSTGQEEVYAWCRHFGDDLKARVSLDSVVGYLPTVPHWGYNGCARRYWDFLYGGKLIRIERQLHHYGSSLNALPALSAFRTSPADTYLLRIGHAGNAGPLSNIDAEGFASAAFHSLPNTLRWDAYSGDYGPNLLGHALGVACYVINDPALGWQAFGGALTQRGNAVTVTPQDSLRRRVFLAPLGAFLTLDAGKFQSVRFDIKKRTVTFTLDPADAHTPVARLRIEGNLKPSGKLTFERGGYTIPLGENPAEMRLSA